MMPPLFWDAMLLVGVVGMSVGVAYLYRPEHKAFILGLPIPSSLALLSLGENVNAGNVLGLSLLLLFAHTVRLLYSHAIMGIMPAIACGVAAYSALGMFLQKVYPLTEAGFVAAVAWNYLLAGLLLRYFPRRQEPGQRSQMPVARKIVLLTAVIGGLLLLKHQLGGFMTAFPMVGVVTAYEGRHALWSLCRQIPLIMITMGAVNLVIHYLHPHLGLGLSLTVAGFLFLAMIIPLHRRMWAQRPANATTAPAK
ncbi:MAG: hypothetical protein PHC30_00875 [Lentisphaeria bacterium]|nr:hypothetical protein [Lentisphaeria bacterium]